MDYIEAGNRLEFNREIDLSGSRKDARTPMMNAWNALFCVQVLSISMISFAGAQTLVLDDFAQAGAQATPFWTEERLLY
jgi:hypothetical protein